MPFFVEIGSHGYLNVLDLEIRWIQIMKRLGLQTRYAKRLQRDLESEQAIRVIQLLLERQPKSSFQLLLNRGLYSFSKRVGLCVYTNYLFVEKSNLDYCLDIGLDPLQVVPIASLQDQAFADWARCKYPIRDVNSRAASISPLKFNGPYFNLSIQACKRMLEHNRFECLESIGAALQALCQLDQVPKGLKEQELWKRSCLSGLLAFARAGRCDLMEWAFSNQLFTSQWVWSACVNQACRSRQANVIEWLLRHLPVMDFAIYKVCRRFYYEANQLPNYWPDNAPRFSIPDALAKDALYIAEHVRVQEGILLNADLPIISSAALIWATSLGWPSDQYFETVLQVLVRDARIDDALAHWNRRPARWIPQAGWWNTIDTFLRRTWTIETARAASALIKAFLAYFSLRVVLRQHTELAELAPLLGVADLIPTLKGWRIASHRYTFWISAIRGYLVSPEAMLWLERGRKLLDLPDSLGRRQFCQALIDCQSDQVWSFVLDIARPNVWVRGFFKAHPLNPTTPEPRLIWLLEELAKRDRIREISLELDSIPVRAKFADLGGTFSELQLIQAVEQNDWQSLDIISMAMFGYRVRVHLTDQFEFTVSNRHETFAWTWPLHLDWPRRRVRVSKRLIDATGKCGLTIGETRLKGSLFSCDSAECLNLLVGLLYRFRLVLRELDDSFRQIRHFQKTVLTSELLHTVI